MRIRACVCMSVMRAPSCLIFIMGSAGSFVAMMSTMIMTILQSVFLAQATFQTITVNLKTENPYELTSPTALHAGKLTASLEERTILSLSAQNVETL